MITTELPRNRRKKLKADELLFCNNKYISSRDVENPNTTNYQQILIQIEKENHEITK